MAFLRQLDEHAAPVVRIGDALHQAGLLETVEPVRHRAAGELGALGELARGPPVRLACKPEAVDHLPLAEAEVELAERLVGHRVEAAPQAVDPVDDALDLEIDARQVVLREEAIDVVMLVGCLGHERIFYQKSLDVKSLHL